MSEVNLSEIVLDTFEELFEEVIDCKVNRAICKGGRNSTKSQFASEVITLGCMVHHASAVCLLKHANKIEQRLVDTFTHSMEYLGVRKYWKLRRSPFEYVLLDKDGKESDVSIRFLGCDDPEMVKSYRPRKGAFRYIWFEELTNFDSVKEVNNIIQTMRRGVGDKCVIMSYNPPQRTSEWVNKEYDVPCGTILGYDSNTYTEEIEIDNGDGTVDKVVQKVHHSTYLDVIESGHKDWLDVGFIADANKAKENNPEYYRWAYLGEITGTDANVFNNIYDWRYEEDKDYGVINRGLDVSNGGSDPWAYTEWYYDKENNDLYCLNEGKLGAKATLEQVEIKVKQINKDNRTVYMDSAVPTFISMLNIQHKLNVIPTKKGHDSQIAGVEWLRSKNHIYIDKYRCPNTYKEFKEYEWFIDKNDEITSKLVDGNDHFIDSTRYAMNMNIRY